MNVDLALITDTQLIGEEFLFNNIAEYSAKSIHHECVIYWIEKEKLEWLLEEYEEIKSILMQ